MEISTFKDDLLDLPAFATRLEKFIEVEHHFVEGGLVLALSSKYGSGKTTFLKMWKSEIESRGNQTEIPLVISLNAWESDYYGDPLFAIISSLINSIEARDEDAKALIDAAKDVGWMATAIGAQIVKKATGIDPVAAGKVAKEKRAEREGSKSLPSNAFSLYQDRRVAMSNLKEAVKEYVKASEPKVIFLVDELDRCRPDYAISYLETIKHIFDVQGAVFILALDRQQLENSARTAFGTDLDFDEYFRKFVHREVTLPPISDSGYGKIASTYVTQYLERDRLRNCFMQFDQHAIERIVELVAAMRLTPRQIQEVFRILGHVLGTSEENKGKLKPILGAASIAMTTLKVGKPKIYHLLGSRRLAPEQAYEFLVELLGVRQVDWWFMLFLTGWGLKTGEGESAEEVMTRIGLLNDNVRERRLQSLNQFDDVWWGMEKRIVHVYEMIEQIAKWN